MKKLSAIFVTMVFLTLMLFSTGITTGLASETAGASGEAVEISFWTYYAEGTDSYEKLVSIVNGFMEANPGVKVNMLGISFWDYWTKLSTSVASGTGPDICFNDIMTVANRAKAGSIYSLDAFMAADGVSRDDYVPALVEACVVDGEAYALPVGLDLRLLYYNKDLFAAAGLDPEVAPATLDELAEYAKALTIWNGSNVDVMGFSTMLGNSYLWMWAWNNGGGFWDADGNPTMNTPENIGALEWMVGIQDYYGTKAIEAFNSITGSTGTDPFIGGKVAMIVQTNSYYNQIEQYAPDMNYGYAPIPTNGDVSHTWLNGTVVEMNNNGDATKAQAAWKFMQYLLSPGVQVTLLEQLGSYPAALAAYDDAAVQDNDFFKAVANAATSGLMINRVFEYSNWHEGLNTFVAEAIAGVKTATQALNDAQQFVLNKIENFNESQ